MKAHRTVYVCVFALGLAIPGSGQDRSPSIPDAYLSEAITRLDKSLITNDQSALVANSYRVKRAANRFEILFGSAEFEKVASVVDDILAESVAKAKNPNDRARITHYREELLNERKI